MVGVEGGIDLQELYRPISLVMFRLLSPCSLAARHTVGHLAVSCGSVDQCL